MKPPGAPSLAAATAAILVVASLISLPSCQNDQTNASVIFIGLDGVLWDVLRPLMESGQAPALASLAYSGIQGRLVTEGGGSPAKWTAMATGVGADRHGITGFQRFENGRMVTLKSYDRRVKALWNYASESGREVGVVNYLVTGPPETVNGYIVTDRRQRCAYPDDLDLTFDQVSLASYFTGDHRGDVEKRRTLNTFVNKLEREFSLAGALFRRHPTDLFIAYTHTTDDIEHFFWKYHQPGLFQQARWKLTDEDVAAFADVIPRFIAAADFMVDQILAAAPDDSVVIIASDHGMKPVDENRISDTFHHDNLYSLLGYQGRDDSGAIAESKPRLISVDPSKYDTREWAKLIIPEGYDPDLRSTWLPKLADALRNLKVEPDGRPLFDSVESRRGDESFPLSPPDWDIRVRDDRRNIIEADRLTLTVNEHEIPLINLVNRLDVSGAHKPEGIFIASGPPIRNSHRILDLRGIDIAPTILHLLGIPIPAAMDGAVMTEIFRDDWLDERPVLIDHDMPITMDTSPSSRSIIPPEEPPSGDDIEESIKLEELRALGYIQ